MREHEAKLYCPFCCKEHEVVVREYLEKGCLHGVTFEFLQTMSICTINNCSFYTEEQEKSNNVEFQQAWDKTFKDDKYKPDQENLQKVFDILNQINTKYQKTLEALAQLEREEKPDD